VEASIEEKVKIERVEWKFEASDWKLEKSESAE